MQTNSIPTSKTLRPSTGWPFVCLLTLLVIASGMAYTLLWPPLVRHHPYWLTPADFWATFRNAHVVAWGSISYVYSRHTALVALPGYPVLMAPIAALSSALGLSESSPSILLPKPEAWLLAGPYVMLTAGIVIDGCRRLLTHFRIPRSSQRLVMISVAAATWPALAMWGHPEDVAATGLLLFSFLYAVRGKWTAAAWLLGAALSMQLMVILALPVFIGMLGWRRIIPFLLRASLLPATLATMVLIPDFHHAWQALTRQPNYPRIDHPTPWVLVAPATGHGTVGAGPGRMIAVAFALVCGTIASRWRGDPSRLLWLIAVSMAGRCVFESVMVPYYVMPAVVLALIAAAKNRKVRWILAATAGTAVTVVTFLHGGEWLYWSGMSILLLAMLAMAWPAVGDPTADAELPEPMSVGTDSGIPGLPVRA